MNAQRNPARSSESSRIVIERQGMARLQDVRGAQLRVVSGSVWITQGGCTADVCIGAGESFRITHDGLTLVCASHRLPAVLEMLEPAAIVIPTLGERLRRFCRALDVEPSGSASATL